MVQGKTYFGLFQKLKADFVFANNNNNNKNLITQGARALQAACGREGFGSAGGASLRGPSSGGDRPRRT